MVLLLLLSRPFLYTHSVRSSLMITQVVFEHAVSMVPFGFHGSLKDEQDIHSGSVVVCHRWRCLVLHGNRNLPHMSTNLGCCYRLFDFVDPVPPPRHAPGTSQQAPTNVMQEMIAGYIFSGRPIAKIVFKTLGTVTCLQAVAFAGDLKMAIT